MNGLIELIDTFCWIGLMQWVDADQKTRDQINQLQNKIKELETTSSK